MRISDADRVLRVTQLDTHELDLWLVDIFRQAVTTDAFKYATSGAGGATILLAQFYKYRVEVFTALKCFIWYHTYYKHGRTHAQSLFEWSYARQQQDDKGQALIKTLTHACLFCFDELIEERLASLCRFVVRSLFAKKIGPKRDDDDDASNAQIEIRIDTWIAWLRRLVRLASFVNYLLFVFNGRYAHIGERLLALRGSYNRTDVPPPSPEASSAVADREALWQTYFLLIRLANRLIDTRKLWRRAHLFFLKQKQQQQLTSKERVILNETCAICEQVPTLVHCDASNIKKTSENAAAAAAVPSCRHVFCYYCVRKHMLENNDRYYCMQCSAHVTQVKPFEMPRESDTHNYNDQ